VTELVRLKDLFERTSDLDMRWTNAYLPNLIKFAKRVPATFVALHCEAIKDVKITKDDLCY